MKILIQGRKTIVNFKGLDKYILISITEPECKFVDLPDDDNRLGVLRIKFPDWDENYIRDGVLYKAITSEQAMEILNFINAHRDSIDTIVCQCDGGVSRSSGLAAALGIIFNGNGGDKFVFDNPFYKPNMKVYRTILDNFYFLLK